MTHVIVLTTLALGLPAAVQAATIPVTSDFDDNLDGWTAWGVDTSHPFTPLLVDHSADLSHSTTDGYPNGYARFDDVV